MLSDRSRQQWGAYTQARGGGRALFRERDELHRFLIGLHLRSEALSAAELGSLLDEAGVHADERPGLVAEIEAGLSLLDAYDRRLREEEEPYSEVETFGGFEI